MGDELAPIIVRRRKIIAAEGHHGGAWKVAYADFVTAMMAFFLLMWLLNATTENQRKGLADYFSTTIPINRISGGGDGSFFGDAIFAEMQVTQVGNGSSDRLPTEHNQARGDSGLDPSAENAPNAANENLAKSKDLLDSLKALGGESMADLLKMRHVVTRISDEGLVIDIAEAPDFRLWDDDGVAARPTLLDTLQTIVDVLRVTPNEVAINAHLASRPIVLAQNPAWDLSAARADAARQDLEMAGFEPSRVQRVTGFADRKPADSNPMHARNNRLEIVVLRQDI